MTSGEDRYKDSAPVVIDAKLRASGDVVDLQNNAIDFQNAVQDFKDRSPIPDKVLQSDGTIVTIADALGTGGGVPTPDPGILADNEMVKANVGGTAIVGTGDTNTDLLVDFGSKDVACKTVITESTSVDIGEGLTLSDNGGDLVNTSNVTGNKYIPIESEYDKITGSKHPNWPEREPEIVKEVTQGDDTQSMIGVTSYVVVPTSNEDISRVYIKFINPVTDFRARVISSTTGKVVKYIPSRNDFNKDTGLSLGAGEQFFDVPGSLREVVGTTLTVEVFANESIDVLGDGVNPWRAVDKNSINIENMALERDLALESISTSLINGGIVSENTPTSVDITAGKGRIVSFDAQGAPTIADVSWDAMTNITVSNIGTGIAHKVAIGVNGDVVFLDETTTPITNRDYINLAIISHPASVISSIINNGYKGQELYSQMLDNFDTMGVTRKSGLSVNINANLTFARTAGVLQGVGSGVASGERGQNIKSFTASSPATFDRILGITNSSESVGVTTIDPGFWDNGSGTKAAIGLPSQQATIIHIYQAISGTTGIVVLYGQTIYPTLDDAILNAPTDIPDLPEVLQGNANLIERIAVISDATNLQDPLQAQALGGVKFGTGLGGAGFGNVSGGGDYFGVSSSTADEIHTFADNGGHTAKSGSDLTAVSGVLKRITAAGNAELQSGNGISKVNVTPTNVIITAKNNAGSNTTSWTLSDSNGILFGGSALNVDGGNGSIGYRSSTSGTLRTQMYWNQVENQTHISHNGTTSSPNSDMVMANDSITIEFSSNKAMSINNSGQLDVDGNNSDVAINLNAELNNDSTINFKENNAIVTNLNWDATNGRFMIDAGTTSIEVNPTTGNLNIADGADGNANFFFGRIKLENPTNEPAYLLYDSLGNPLGGISWEPETTPYLSVFTGNINSKGGEVRIFEDGTVETTTTTAAFVPPQVTSVERNAISPVGIVSDTDLGILFHGDGVEWTPLSINVSLIGRVIVQNNIPLSGVFQPITTGTFAFYEIKGQTATPNFTNGIWTCPISGTYQFNLSGWAFTGSSSDSQCRFYTAVNGLNYGDILYPGVDQVTKNGAGLAVNGIVKLEAGDEVQISYSVLSGTGWELDNFRWDVSRVGS